MDEKDFKKHLKDLAHGHHHPEEHDWPERGAVRAVAAPAKTVKAKVRTVKAKAKTGGLKRAAKKK
jgi:hypothetical protein